MMSSAMARTYDGGCHCGRVRFRVTANLRTPAVAAHVCARAGFEPPLAKPRLRLPAGPTVADTAATGYAPAPARRSPS